MTSTIKVRKPRKRKVKSVFTKDEFGAKVLLKNGAIPVAMKWEQPYIEASIKAMKPSGDILEIGFGLGYAARRLQKCNPTSHTIIEHDPVVLKKLQAWSKKHPNVKIIDRPWQEVLPELKSYDVIYFNDYEPLSECDMEELKQHLAESQGVAEKTQELRRDLLSAVEKFHGIQFSNEELNGFLKSVWSQPNVSKEQVVDFIELLASSRHITDTQKNNGLEVIKKQFSEGNVPEKKAHIPWMQHKSLLVSRLIEFAIACLNKHMKPGSRLSGFVGTANSLTTIPEFKNKVLSRPDVKFTEKLIKVKVPANCTYFTGDKAIVITIEKK